MLQVMLVIMKVKHIKLLADKTHNNSVRIPNEFFKALEEDGDWELKARSDGRVMKKIPAKNYGIKLLMLHGVVLIPGTQYDTTINEWHTCPEGGRIRHLILAVNICSWIILPVTWLQ